MITFEASYVKYDLWFLYLIKQLPLYGDFLFQVIIKCPRCFVCVSKVLSCKCHSQGITLIYQMREEMKDLRLS